MRIYKNMRLLVTTVGALPAAASTNAGLMRMVTDATTAAARATVTAGGANTYVVISTGTVWIIVS